MNDREVKVAYGRIMAKLRRTYSQDCAKRSWPRDIYYGLGRIQHLLQGVYETADMFTSPISPPDSARDDCIHSSLMRVMSGCLRMLLLLESRDSKPTLEKPVDSVRQAPIPDVTPQKFESPMGDLGDMLLEDISTVPTPGPDALSVALKNHPRGVSEALSDAFRNPDLFSYQDLVELKLAVQNARDEHPDRELVDG